MYSTLRVYYTLIATHAPFHIYPKIQNIWKDAELVHPPRGDHKKDNNGNKTYFHNDHLGSTTVLTNSSSGVIEKTEYDPWGEVKDGGTKSKFQYTGQEKDLETGLNYYNYRYYDSHTRRFTQPDDIIQNVYAPQDLNRYSYVRNNPLRYTDPSGHIAVVPIILIGAGIGAAANMADVALANPHAGWQDYGNAALIGAGTGAVTTGAAILATPFATTGLATLGFSGAAKAIGADAIVGGGITGLKTMYGNISNNRPTLQNVPQAIGIGSFTAGLASFGANKIIPQTQGRPSEKLSISFNGVKSVEQARRYAVNEFVERLTLPYASSVIKNSYVIAPKPKQTKPAIKFTKYL